MAHGHVETNDINRVQVQNNLYVIILKQIKVSYVVRLLWEIRM